MFTSSERAQVAAEVGATTTRASRMERTANPPKAARKASTERAGLR